MTGLCCIPLIILLQLILVETTEEPESFWMTGPHGSSSSDTITLESRLKSGGYFQPWGIPFSSFAAVPQAINRRKILLVGDSYLMNFFIEIIDLWSGIASNTSTANIKIGNNKPERIRYGFVKQAAQTAEEQHIPIKYFGLARDAHMHRCVPWVREYGIATLVNLNTSMGKRCFQSYLRQYDTIISDVYIHDVASPNMTRDMYPRMLRMFVQSIPDDIKQKMLWIGPKGDTITSKIPRNRKCGATETINSAVRAIMGSAGITFVDMYALTKTCKWQNCTVSDGHHSRMVLRVLVLHVLDVLRLKEVKKPHTNLRRTWKDYFFGFK